MKQSGESSYGFDEATESADEHRGRPTRSMLCDLMPTRLRLSHDGKDSTAQLPRMCKRTRPGLSKRKKDMGTPNPPATGLGVGYGADCLIARGGKQQLQLGSAGFDSSRRRRDRREASSVGEKAVLRRGHRLQRPQPQPRLGAQGPE